MFRATLIAFASLLACVISCSDEITNNYYEFTNGAVFGNVVPADSGTAELHGLSELKTTIDPNGFFNFASVPPGTYTLELKPQNHGRRIRYNVLVGTGVTTQFRNTTISPYPFPVFAVYPGMNAVNVWTSHSIEITCDEEMNIADLNTFTTFNPPATGQWHEVAWYRDPNDYGPFHYEFLLDLALAPLTEYQMTISAQARTSMGDTLEYPLVTKFTTQDYGMRLHYAKNPYNGKATRRGFRLYAESPRCVDTDSVARAIRLEPRVMGVWVPVDRGNNCSDLSLSRDHDFMAAEELQANTSYRVFIDGRPLGTVTQDTIEFTTEGYEVVNMRPRNGYQGVPKDNQVIMVFSDAMDTVSVQAAFSVSRIGGLQVPGTFAWNSAQTEFTWSHWDNPYQPGLYAVRVTTDATTQDGHSLDVAWESYFTVQ